MNKPKSSHPAHGVSVCGKWAVITGASSGLGKEFAAGLAERGAHLVLVARRIEPMQHLAAQLRAQHGVQVIVEGMDLSLFGAARQLGARLEAQCIATDILINNAAFGLISEFVDQPLERLSAMLQLNVVALTELTHEFARGMALRGGGHILLVGSVGGFQPVPSQAVYSATKAYVLSLGEALHVELAERGVVVTVLSPGVTQTEFFEKAGPAPASLLRMMMPARPVVDIGLRALFRRRSGVIAGAMNHLLTFSSRLLPRRVVARTAYRMYKG